MRFYKGDPAAGNAQIPRRVFKKQKLLSPAALQLKGFSRIFARTVPVNFHKAFKISKYLKLLMLKIFSPWQAGGV